MNEERQIDAGLLALGASLIVAGLVVALVRLDLVAVSGLARLWPLLVISGGLVYLLAAPVGEQRRTGLWMVLVGGWLLLNTLAVGGLFWHNSWPLMMVLVGLFHLAWPGKGEQRGGHLTVLAVGVWLTLTVSFGWLDWRTAWPLLLVFVGLSLITGSLMRALPALRGGR